MIYFCIRKNTDLPLNKTEAKPQESLEFILTKSMRIFPLNSRIKTEEGKRTFGLIPLEVFNAVFNIANITPEIYTRDILGRSRNYLENSMI